MAGELPEARRFPCDGPPGAVTEPAVVEDCQACPGCPLPVLSKRLKELQSRKGDKPGLKQK